MKRNILKNKLSDFIFNLIEDKIKAQIVEIFLMSTGNLNPDKENDSPLVSLPSEFYPRFKQNSNVIDLNKYRTSMKLNKFIKGVFNISDRNPDPPKSTA